jgi:hypothetical protein
LSGSLSLDGVVTLLSILYCGGLAYLFSQAKDHGFNLALTYFYYRPLDIIPPLFLVIRVILSANNLTPPSWSCVIPLLIMLGRVGQIAAEAERKPTPSSRVEPARSPNTGEVASNLENERRDLERKREAEEMISKQLEQEEAVQTQVFKKSIPADFKPVNKEMSWGKLTLGDNFGELGFMLSAELASCAPVDYDFLKLRIVVFDASEKVIEQKDFVVAGVARRQRTKISVLLSTPLKKVHSYILKVVD